jgi:hypothetical protein
MMEIEKGDTLPENSVKGKGKLGCPASRKSCHHKCQRLLSKTVKVSCIREVKKESNCGIE